MNLDRNRSTPRRLASRGFVVLAAAALAGCAGGPAPRSAYEVDHAQIARVERAARAIGTQVIWVNYPTKQVASKP